MNTIYSNTNRPVFNSTIVNASNFAWLSSEEQQAVMSACIQGGNELKSCIVTMHDDRITIELTQWHPDTCAADLFHQLGGGSRMALIEAQTTYLPMTKAEIVTSAIQNKTFRHALDLSAQAYWCKENTRATLINELTEIALGFIPAHLNLDRLLRREVNQEFRIRIA